MNRSPNNQTTKFRQQHSRIYKSKLYITNFIDCCLIIENARTPTHSKDEKKNENGDLVMGLFWPCSTPGSGIKGGNTKQETFAITHWTDLSRNKLVFRDIPIIVANSVINFQLLCHPLVIVFTVESHYWKPLYIWCRDWTSHWKAMNFDQSPNFHQKKKNCH